MLCIFLYCLCSVFEDLSFHIHSNMGIDVRQWRARIGCFSQPIKTANPMKTLRLRHVSLAIRALLFLLLVVQGLESNPGPYNRGRGGQGGKGGRGRGRDFDPDPFNVLGSLRRSTRNRSNAAQNSTPSGAQLSQQQLTSWYTNINQPQESAQVSNINPNQQTMPDNTQLNCEENRGAEQTQSDENNSDTDSEVDIDPNETDIDVESEINLKTILLDIRKDVKQINHKFDTMKKSIKDLKKSNKLLQRQNVDLTKTVSDLKDQVDNLETTVQKNTDANERIEAQSRRSNLIFYGIQGDKKES